MSPMIRDLVITPMERGDIREMSFAWITKRRDAGDSVDGDEWVKLGNGKFKRLLKRNGCKEILDASIVTYPAYKSTDVSIAQRSLQQWCRGRGLVVPVSLDVITSGQAARERELELQEYEMQTQRFRGRL
jgi:phage head maturation protease